MFKVGDKVTCVKIIDNCDAFAECLGKTGEVMNADPNLIGDEELYGEFAYDVDFGGFTGYLWETELVEAAPVTEHERPTP